MIGKRKGEEPSNERHQGPFFGRRELLVASFLDPHFLGRSR
jgi:hypothetical protein